MTLPKLDPLVDDLGSHHDLSPYSIEVDGYSTGIGEQLYQQTKRSNKFQLADCFHACYNDEVALHPNANELAASWWRDMFAGGTAGSLRIKTIGNQFYAEAAASKLADELDNYINNLPEGHESDSIGAMAARIRSCRRAVQVAEQECNLLEALGQSFGPGPGGILNREELMKVHARIGRSRKLREILELAGAMMKVRRAKKKVKVDGIENVDGVTTSGDLTRILPSELMLLGDELTELNLLRKLCEEQTLALRKHSWESQAKGPIVVCVDESGSMVDTRRGRTDDSKLIQAKAFALTMARIAQEEKRFIVLMGFSSEDQLRELVMPPEKWNQTALLEWLEHFFNGGTDFDFLLHLEKSWDKWKCPRGKTDVFIVTDTQADITDCTVEQFNAFKLKEKVKAYGLAIGAATGCLDLVCDQAWVTQSMGLESKAVREILSS
jgi:uncharacterized protein with von Willebrand factor type A (vWA) domain